MKNEIDFQVYLFLEMLIEKAGLATKVDRANEKEVCICSIPRP